MTPKKLTAGSLPAAVYCPRLPIFKQHTARNFAGHFAAPKLAARGQQLTVQRTCGKCQKWVFMVQLLPAARKITKLRLLLRRNHCQAPLSVTSPHKNTNNNTALAHHIDVSQSLPDNILSHHGCFTYCPLLRWEFVSALGVPLRGRFIPLLGAAVWGCFGGIYAIPSLHLLS